MLVLIATVCILIVLFLLPKLVTGRILYMESFVPQLQVYQKMIERDLSNVPVKIQIVHRKLYNIKVFRIFKPIFGLLPSEYSVLPNKDGLFRFWAYPFDVVHIFVGEDKFRQSYTLRHKIIDFAPVCLKLFYSVVHLFSPVMLHEECIEFPTTLGKTCGYANKLSISPGEDIELMISTASETFSTKLLRVGKGLDSIESTDINKGIYQNIDTKFPSVLGCGWKPTLKYRVPERLKSGCYIIKLTGKNKSDVSFIPVIVKPDKPNNSIAVIASTNTWHAYNSWGGNNFYINYTSFPSKYLVSTERPFDLYIRNPIEDKCEVTRDHLLVGERLIWAWLEREGFNYDLYSDHDLHSEKIYNDIIKNYKVILISTHNEYWSFGMIENLKDFIAKGGNVLSLSGNTLYKEVRYLSDRLIVLDGAYLRYQGFKEEMILGVAHDLRGFMKWSPYKVMRSDHYVFDNTNLKNGDLFGKIGLNVSPENNPGASGWETDKIYPSSPKSTTLLAKGINPGEGGADMIICQEPGQGAIFSVGSISYGGSLLVDEHISQITKNVLNRFIA